MYNILICDDERDIVNALKIYLNDINYTLYEAFNGKEALKVIEEQDIHLVLLDIMMPEMDGMEAMVKIREKSNVPIILLTAKSEDSDKILGLTVGADDYITKPFNPVEVSARVKSQLRRYMQLGAGNMKPQTIRCGAIEMDDSAKKGNTGRGGGFSDTYRVRYLKAFDAESGAGIFSQRNLSQNLE